MFALRLLVTCAILIPYWLVRMPHDTIEIFVVAVVAFGTGRVVEMIVKNKKRATAAAPPKQPPAT